MNTKIILITALILLAAAADASTVKIQPTGFLDPNNIGSNEANAYDNNSSTYAIVSLQSSTTTRNLDFVNYTNSNNGTITNLNVTFDINVTGTSNDQWGLQYSDNNGTNYYDLRTLATGNQTRTNLTYALTEQSAGTNGVWNFTEIKNNIRIRIQSKKVGGNDNAVFRLDELWLNATYSDATPPTQTVTSVGGDTAAPWSTSNTTPLINITLNEPGDCRASQLDENYSDMSNDVDCSGDGTTSISCQMGALAESASKTIYVACKDLDGNQDTVASNTHITLEIDATPPTKSGYSPASGSTINSTSQTLTFTTNEISDCFASFGW